MSGINALKKRRGRSGASVLFSSLTSGGGAAAPSLGVESTTQEDITKRIARLLYSPDPAHQKQGQELAAKFSGDLSAAVKEGFGFKVPLAARAGRGATRGAASALEVLGRPSNALQEGFQAGLDTLGVDDALTEHFSPGAARLAEGEDLAPLSEDTRKIIGEGAGSGGYGDIVKALAGTPRWDPTSQTYTRNLTLAGAMGQDPAQLGDSVGGKTVNAADFVGTAALDPLNLIGAGSSAAAKEVSKTAAKEIVESGAKSLTPALERQLARQGSAEVTEEAVQAALKRTGLRTGLTAGQRERTLARLVEDSAGKRVTRTGREIPLRPDSWRNPMERAVRTGRGVREGDVRAAENLLTQATRYDRGGLRVAGRSLPEGVKAPVRNMLLGREQVLGRAPAAGAVMDDVALKSKGLLAGAERARIRAAGYQAQADLIGAVDPEAQAAALTQSRRAESTAERLLSQAEDTPLNAEEALAADPSLGVVNPPVVERFRGRRPDLTSLVRKFRPREELRRSESLPPGTDEALYNIEATARAIGGQEARRFGRELESVAKKVGEIDDPTRKAMLDALDRGGSVDEVAAVLPESQATYLKKLDELRQSTYKLMVKKGLADPKKLQQAEEYMARVYTPAGERAVKAASNSSDQLLSPFRDLSSASGLTRQDGHLLTRKIDPELSISEFAQKWEPILRDKKMLKPGETLMETDPATIIAKRHNDAIKALQQIEVVDGMEKGLKGILGDSLVMRERPGGAKIGKVAKARKMTPIDLGPAGTVYAHPDLVPEITKFFNVLSSSEDVRQFGRFMDGWNKMWKAYATVPVVTGTGFHTKNSIGNMFNNYLAGVNLSAYGEATSLQKDIFRARRAFPDLPIPEALRANGVSGRRAALAESALNNGVLDEGFFSIDLADNPTLSADVKTRSRLRKAGALVDVRNPSEMFGVRTGRKVGEAVEDNARLAHFISKVDELGDPALAASSVKKYLFDYGDLTDFERTVMKRIHAFYTFTRKNTPLQFSELVRNPAAGNRLTMAENMLLGEGEATGPEYLDEIGTPVGKGQAALLSGGSNGVVANIDTPLDAAVKTAAPLRFPLSPLTGDKSATAQESMSFLDNVSGGPAELVKAAIEEKTGRSVFSGADIRDPDGKRKVNPLLRVSNAFVPSISKGVRLANVGGKQTDSPRLRAIKALTGLSAREVTPDMEAQAMRAKLREIDEIIKELGDVPTLEELQTLGILPRLSRSDSEIIMARLKGER